MESGENSLKLTQKFAQLVIDQASRTQGAGLHEQLVNEVSAALRPELGKLQKSIDVLRQDVGNQLQAHQNEQSAFRQRGTGSHELSEQLRELASSSQTMNQNLMTRLGAIESQLAGRASSRAQGSAPQMGLDLQNAPPSPPFTKPEPSAKGQALAPWTPEYGKLAAAFALGVLLTLALVWLKGAIVKDEIPAPGPITAPASGGSGNAGPAAGKGAKADSPKQSEQIGEGKAAETKDPNDTNAGPVDQAVPNPGAGNSVKSTKYVLGLADILSTKVTDPNKARYLRENVLTQVDGMRIEVLEQLMQGKQAPTIAAYFYQALAIKEGQKNQKIDGVLDSNGKTMEALRQIPCVSKAPNVRKPGKPALLDPVDNLVSVIHSCANR